TSGTYTAQLTVSNNYGCRDSITKNFNISLFSAGAVSGDTICQKQTTNLQAGGGTSYTWTPSGTLSNPNIANPTASPSVTTIYSVAITNTISGCSKTLTTQIVVNPKPTAGFTFSVNPCGGGVYFTDQSIGATQWNWNFGSTQTSTVQNAYNFYNTGGTYSVSLIVKNNSGCSDTITKPVSVGTPPPVSVSANTVVCLGGNVTLTAAGGFSYAWSPAASLSSTNTAVTVATPTVNTTYSVIVSAINSLGDTCHFLLTPQVSVAQISSFPVSISASPDTVLKGNSSTLSLNASPGALATWYPLGSTSPIYGYTANVTPEITTTYTVVITRGPCTQNLKVTVVVLDDVCSESDVYIPNTFTPNGDGENDIMYVRGAKISELYFAIYNRWGEMVFETRDKNVGWDGIYKGRQADVGVFGYYVKAKCINGLETFRKGNITLIR
ncbi:MAG: T9SS type B sorting domain-containing protein, partial [Bacteroidia bacterium]